MCSIKTPLSRRVLPPTSGAASLAGHSADSPSAWKGRHALRGNRRNAPLKHRCSVGIGGMPRLGGVASSSTRRNVAPALTAADRFRGGSGARVCLSKRRTRHGSGPQLPVRCANSDAQFNERPPSRRVLPPTSEVASLAGHSADSPSAWKGRHALRGNRRNAPLKHRCSVGIGGMPRLGGGASSSTRRTLHRHARLRIDSVAGPARVSAFPSGGPATEAVRSDHCRSFQWLVRRACLPFQAPDKPLKRTAAWTSTPGRTRTLRRCATRPCRRPCAPPSSGTPRRSPPTDAPPPPRA